MSRQACHRIFNAKGGIVLSNSQKDGMTTNGVLQLSAIHPPVKELNISWVSLMFIIHIFETAKSVTMLHQMHHTIS
jgi:hypothetical protein